MAAGPGRIQRPITIDLSYPRERTSDAFTRVRRALFAAVHLIHQDTANAPARDKCSTTEISLPLPLVVVVVIVDDNDYDNDHDWKRK